MQITQPRSPNPKPFSAAQTSEPFRHKTVSEARANKFSRRLAGSGLLASGSLSEVMVSFRRSMKKYVRQPSKGNGGFISSKP